MNNKKFNVRLIPKYITLFLVSILVLSFAVGLFRDIQGEYCSGIMGAEASCVEESLYSPVLVAVPLILVFGTLWLTSHIERANSLQKSKKRSKK